MSSDALTDVRTEVITTILSPILIKNIASVISEYATLSEIEQLNCVLSTAGEKKKLILSPFVTKEYNIIEFYVEWDYDQNLETAKYKLCAIASSGWEYRYTRKYNELLPTDKHWHQYPSFGGDTCWIAHLEYVKQMTALMSRY